MGNGRANWGGEVNMRKVEKPDISKPSKDFSSRLIDHQCSSLEEEKAIANYLVKIRYQFSNADLLRIKGWAKYRQVSIAEILIRGRLYLYI